jgi:phage terminase small subunit
MTRRREAFLDAYFGIAKLNATEAARIAGFRHPRVAGTWQVNQLREVIDSRMVELRNARIMSADEVLEHLASIGRDVQHKDRVKALELMARINGLVSDKLSVSIDHRQIKADLDAEFHVIQQALPPAALGSEPKAPS